MKTSQALTDYTEEKVIQRIEKFSTKPIDAHITFSVEGYNQIAHCSVKGGDGFNFEVESTCKDMYGSVDLLVDKLAVQLKKQKDKLKNHKQVSVDELPLEDMQDLEECDNVPVDAADLLKYTQAKG
jgi:putative sigma-54 modulation protein